MALDRVTASFGAAPVIRDLSLSVEAGATLAILGANGAGKSACLKTVAGLLRVRGGTILLDGVDVTHFAPERRARIGMAYVTQTRNLFARMTVEENIRAGTRLSGDAVDAVFERFPLLAQRRRHKAATLSGGERSLLALARAIARRPRLLTVDEPTAGVSSSLEPVIAAALADLRANGTAVLLVEQNRDFALRHANRVIVLERGVVAYEGAGPLPPDPAVSSGASW